MSGHLFLMKPGLWVGEGRIIFSSSPELIRYYTRWTVEPLEKGMIIGRQLVEIQGANENVLNTFKLTAITPLGFDMELSNDLVGSVHGKGLIEANKIAWEFKERLQFEGFEVYRLEENGDYMIHAEYASAAMHRTTIDGRIWQKS